MPAVVIDSPAVIDLTMPPLAPPIDNCSLMVVNAGAELDPGTVILPIAIICI